MNLLNPLPLLPPTSQLYLMEGKKQIRSQTVVIHLQMTQMTGSPFLGFPPPCKEVKQEKKKKNPCYQLHTQMLLLSKDNEIPFQNLTPQKETRLVIQMVCALPSICSSTPTSPCSKFLMMAIFLQC